MQDLYTQTLVCLNKECLFQIRVGKIMKNPPTSVGPLSYCPQCGGKAFAKTDNDVTYMETIASAWGLPVQVLQLIMVEWNPKEYPKLYDFVQELKKVAAKT